MNLFLHRAGGAGVLVATLTLLGGCHDRDRAPVRIGAVPAAEFARTSSDLRSYDVRLLDNNLDVELELIGDDGQALGTMTVAELVATDDPARDGSLIATLETPEGWTLTLVTRGVREGRGYRNAMVLSDDAGARIEIDASFDYQQCYDGAFDDASGPACVGKIDLRDGVYTVPDCGPPRLALERTGLATALTRLRYRVPEPVSAPEGGALRYRDGRLVAAEIEVLGRDGSLAERDVLSRWLADTGADALIGSAPARRLAAAMLDTGWRVHADGLLIARLGVGAKRCSAGKLGFDGEVDAKAGCLGSEWLQNANTFFGLGWGDPHFVNYHGTGFDYQGAGEYLLARSDGDDGFVLQGRLEPVDGAPMVEACGKVSITTALALEIGGTRIGFYPGRPGGVLDGAAVSGPAQLSATLPAGVDVTVGDGATHFTWTDGTELRVFERVPMRYELELSPARRGRVDGLIGFYGLSDSDSFRTRDGRTLTAPLEGAQLYGDYAGSWRIGAGESLFEYGPGESTASFQRLAFPAGAPGGVEDLPPELRAQGEAACADVQGDPQRRWCVLDAVCLGPVIVADALALPAAARDLSDVDGVVLSGAVRRALPTQVNALPDAAASCALPAPTRNDAFVEQRGVALTATVEVDLAAPGELTGASGGSIAAGTRVDIHFLNLLPGDSLGTRSGSLRFSRPILGVVATPAGLAATDPLGRADLSYPGAGDPLNAERGLEIGEDRLRIGTDRRELTFELSPEPGLDQVRVFVEALP